MEPELHVKAHSQVSRPLKSSASLAKWEERKWSVLASKHMAVPRQKSQTLIKPLQG